MGLKKEALDLSRRALQAENPSDEEIAAAVQAISVQEDKPRRWAPQIDALPARIGKRRTHRLREVFLQFYSAADDHASAARYAYDGKNFSPMLKYIAVNALILSGQTEKAGEFGRWLRMPKDPDPMDYEAICEARALVLSATGDNFMAVVTRLKHPVQGPLLRSHAEGFVYSALALCIQKLDELRQNREETPPTPDEVDLAVPGLTAGLTADELTLLRKWRRRLVHLVPHSQLKEYAVSAAYEPSRKIE